MLKHCICELFWRWATIFAIELDAEVVISTARIMAGCEQHTTNTVTDCGVLMAYIGRTGRSGHHPVLWDVHLTDSIRASQLNHCEDSLDVVIAPITANQQDVLGFNKKHRTRKIVPDCRKIGLDEVLDVVRLLEGLDGFA